MLEVTHVGSFYSFLPVMCRADPEQAGVLFSCNEAEWTRGSSPAVARLGLCRWSEAGVLGPAPRHRPPACWVSPREGGGLDSQLPLHAHSFGLSWSFNGRSSRVSAKEGGSGWGGKAAILGREARVYTVKVLLLGNCIGTIAQGTHRTVFVPLVATCQGTFHD